MAKQVTSSERFAETLRYMPVFTPIFSLVLGLLVLSDSCLRKRSHMRCWKNETRCLVLSGLLYMSGYLVIGVASDYRYQLWSMIAIFVAALSALAEEPLLRMQLSKRGWLYMGILLATSLLILAAHAIEGDATSASSSLFMASIDRRCNG